MKTIIETKKWTKVACREVGFVPETSIPVPRDYHGSGSFINKKKCALQVSVSFESA